MVFLPHVREAELSKAVFPIEAEQQLAVAHRDISRHNPAPFILMRLLQNSPLTIIVILSAAKNLEFSDS
jgi:hypothetical protein